MTREGMEKANNLLIPIRDIENFLRNKTNGWRRMVIGLRDSCGKTAASLYTREDEELYRLILGVIEDYKTKLEQELEAL